MASATDVPTLMAAKSPKRRIRKVDLSSDSRAAGSPIELWKFEQSLWARSRRRCRSAPQTEENDSQIELLDQADDVCDLEASDNGSAGKDELAEQSVDRTSGSRREIMGT